MRLMMLGTLVLAGLAACRDKSSGEADDGSGTVSPEDGDGDGYAAGDGDCDDGDASSFPGASEICDGVDNDCDGAADDGATATFYEDDDGDGYGDAEGAIEACEQPAGAAASADDCDDGDAESYPGADERCDERDNDCDGEADEDVLALWYLDADQDGYGDPEAATEECDPSPRYVAGAGDCDDLDPTAFPGGEEVCDEADNDCDGSTDEGLTATFYQDTDGDGVGAAGVAADSCDPLTGYAAVSGDCDDADPAISPYAVELCDEIDNDCDGDTDEDSAADAPAWYGDSDGDGFGGALFEVTSCEEPSSYVDNSLDCDDLEPASFPGGEEVCDEVDNDCDGETDEGTGSTFYADDDGDGYGDPGVTADGCEAPPGYVSDDADCDDAEAGINPGEQELCGGADDDCDGETDEDSAADAATWYADSDGDGYGSAVSQVACDQPAGFSAAGGDCDDGEPASNPGSAEACDELDNDCDGSTDEGLTATFYEDDDGDGYGDPGDPIEACEQPPGAVEDDQDCDDTDAAVSPEGTEDCGDGRDDDCDGQADNGALGEYEACAGASCDDILQSGAAAASDGVYWIDPGGDPYEVWCDMTAEDGGWTLLAVFTNADSANWLFSSAYWVNEGGFGAPTSPSTNADAKSQAFDDLPIDEVMIVHYPGSVGVVTSAGCVNNSPMISKFRANSEGDANCASACATSYVAAPWTGQSNQDGSALRFRCRDNETTVTINGYLSSQDDNSMISTLNNASNPDLNFGLGAGYTSSAVDWDSTTTDYGDGADTTQVLLFGR